MKKLTNYQRTAQYLNKVFKLINEEYFNNELEVPTITIQSTLNVFVALKEFPQQGQMYFLVLLGFFGLAIGAEPEPALPPEIPML